MKRKGGFLLFISACIPGCGQMYQGYMKRGTSLLAIVCLLIAIASVLNLGELAIFLPLLWLYAFFDSYNIHGQTDEEAASNPDGWLFGLSSVDNEKLSALYRGKHSIIGWILVILGVIALYNTVASDWLYDLLPDWLYPLIRYDLPRIAVILLIIALGVWFIRGPKAKAGAEDFPPFTPPADRAETEDDNDGEN